jgi:hypothetical protein
MKNEEVLVAESLKQYYKNKGSKSSYCRGDDPPDIDLKINEKRIGVEVMQVMDFVSKPYEDSIKTFLHNENYDCNDYWISVESGDIEPTSEIKGFFREQIKKKLQCNNSPEGEYKYPDDGLHCVTLKIEKSNVGFFSSLRFVNYSSSSPEDQLYRLVLGCIQTKNKKCENLRGDNYLALLDRFGFIYWDTDQKLFLAYKKVFQAIKNFGCFKGCFIVLQSGSVQKY